jgi:hypothetical protein
MDFDPRDDDSRDDERHGSTPNRGNRGASDDRDRDDDWRQPHYRPRDRDDEDARTLGRGPGNDRQASDEHGPDRRDDVRWAERDRDGRERDREPRDAFARHVHLPRGLERELVRDRDREYTLRGSTTAHGSITSITNRCITSSVRSRVATASACPHASRSSG